MPVSNTPASGGKEPLRIPLAPKLPAVSRPAVLKTSSGVISSPLKATPGAFNAMAAS